jgi:hypothetical protein
MIPPARPARKNLVLLAAIIVMQVAQPLLGHRSVEAGAFFDTVFAAIGLVFFVVFEHRWQRRLPSRSSSRRPWAMSRITCSPRLTVVGSGVPLLRRRVSRLRGGGDPGGHLPEAVINGDDVIGALCGYLLGALVWASVHADLSDLPRAFIVKPEIAWRLDRWHLRRALFDYLSFTTLTGLGTPTSAPAAAVFTHVDGGDLRAVLHGGGGRAAGRPQAGGRGPE